MRFFYWFAFYVNRARFEWARGTRDGYAASPTSKDEKILALLREGAYVSAIKTHRELYGTSLKDAKDAVDALASKHNLSR